MEIRYLKRTEIDDLKWNSCVHYASNGNIYGYTWYLDNVAADWDGLVEGDYDSVFPLTWNDKLLKIKQLYQPFFTQQLGLFSIHLISEKRLRAFLAAIPAEFRYTHINLNERNVVKPDWGFEVVAQPNFLLFLNDSYETIADGYSSNLKRHLKKAWKEKLTLTTSIKPEVLVELFRTTQGAKIPELTDAAYHTAHRIIYNALHRGMGFLSGVLNEKNELIAAGFFLISHHRMVNLLPTSTAEGRERRAMHLLLDVVIQQNAGRPMIFDFEGSSIAGVADFYKSFGPTNVPYYQVKRNDLPFWLKWAKH